MGYLPRKELGVFPFVAIAREEYSTFLDMATEQIVNKLKGRLERGSIKLNS